MSNPPSKKKPTDEPKPDEKPVAIDPDDAMIEEPKDDVFEKDKKPQKSKA